MQPGVSSYRNTIEFPPVEMDLIIDSSFVGPFNNTEKSERVRVTQEIVWVRTCGAKYFYIHGEETLKDGTEFCDWGEFGNAAESLHEDMPSTLKHYGITPESSLEIRGYAWYEDIPTLGEVPEDFYNSINSHYKPAYYDARKPDQKGVILLGADIPVGSENPPYDHLALPGQEFFFPRSLERIRHDQKMIFSSRYSLENNKGFLDDWMNQCKNLSNTPIQDREWILPPRL